MTSVEFPAVARILGGRKILHKSVNNYFDLIELCDCGIPKVALTNLATYLQLSLNQMAQILPISERTIQRYETAELFDRPISEQILHIARVAARGSQVFGDKMKFLSWLRQPNTALANQTPLDLLKSRFGTDMVLDELGRMEHGVFS